MGWGLLLLPALVQAALPDKDGAEKAADPRQKVICKRFVKTGSLVDAYRTCKTKAEWDRDRETMRASMTVGSGACNRPDDSSGPAGAC
jgi:hypothetical protein